MAFFIFLRRAKTLPSLVSGEPHFAAANYWIRTLFFHSPFDMGGDDYQRG